MSDDESEDLRPALTASTPGASIHARVDSAPGSRPTPTLLPLLILEKVLERGDPWGVTALAAALDLPKARIHRHLTSLRESGFLSQDLTTRTYEPGWRLLLLGQRISRRAELLTVARPVMTKLRDEIGQTIVLSQLTDHGVTVTEVIPGGSPIDVILSPGTQFGYNSAAQGKVALAFGSPDQVRTWSRVAPEQRTPSTIMDPERLRAHVASTRRQGWATAPEETFRGVNAIAAPVFTHGGDLICTLAVIASIHYLPDPPSPDVVDALTNAADALSQELGHQR